MPSRRLISIHCLCGLIPFFLTLAWGNLGLYHDPNRVTGLNSIPMKMFNAGGGLSLACVLIFSALSSPVLLDPYLNPPGYTLYIFPLIFSFRLTFFTLDSEFLVQKYHSHNISSFEQYNSTSPTFHLQIPNIFLAAQ